MEEKQSIWKIVGMQRDIAESSFNTQFSYENMNIRISAINNNTALAITNEKGTKELIVKEYTEHWIPEDMKTISFDSMVIGTAVLNKYLILFLCNGKYLDQEKPDYIYKCWLDGEYLMTELLYNGNLNFKLDHPLETIVSYENENIQKVYWTDGINQPRVINIAEEKTNRDNWNDDTFNFIRELKLQEQITITNNPSSNGIFPPGTIQYVFTYYNKYGQETNIFYQSSLNYVAHLNRGGSPEDKCSNAFDIEITNLDTSFSFVRIYSILRTSIDATPVCRHVIDLPITEDSIFYTDNGTLGDDVDPTLLFYIGGEACSFETFTHKDNTLFLGNIKNLVHSLTDSERNEIKYRFGKNITFESPDLNTDPSIVTESIDNSAYYYHSQLSKNSKQITTFKYGETYRFGIQFQHYTGKWSDPIFIDDVVNDNRPNIRRTPNDIDTLQYANTKAVYRIPINQYMIAALQKARSAGYVKIRGVIVYPEIHERTCVCQGIVCPTVYNTQDRMTNSPFVQSSWFARPNAPFSIEHFEQNSYSAYTTQLTNPEFISPNLTRWSTYAQEDFVLKSNEYNGRDWMTYIYMENGLDGLHIGEDTPLGAMALSAQVYGFYGDATTHTLVTGSDLNTANSGVWAEFRHNRAIPSNTEPNAEIQCVYKNPFLPYITKNIQGAQGNTSYNYFVEPDKWVKKWMECFYIDQSIFTLHSPDLEFDDTIQNFDYSNLKFRIVGYIPITGQSSDIDITTSSAQLTLVDHKGNVSQRLAQGFSKEPCEVCNVSIRGWKQMLAVPVWNDEVFVGKKNHFNNQVIPDEGDKPIFDDDKLVYPNDFWGNSGIKPETVVKWYNKMSYGASFVVYPWHRNGSLNNQSTAIDGYRSSMLANNRRLVHRFSAYPVYLDNPWEAYKENDNTFTGVSGVSFYNNQENPLVRLKAPLNSGLPDLNYYANIDKIICWGIGDHSDFPFDQVEEQRQISGQIDTTWNLVIDENSHSKSVGYPIVTGTYDKFHELFKTTLSIPDNSSSNIEYRLSILRATGDLFTNDPVSMKYKSTAHMIMALNYTTDHKQRILPTLYDPIDLENYEKESPCNHISDEVSYIDGSSQPRIRYPFWDLKNKTWQGVSQDALKDENDNPITSNFGYLWLGELYNDNIKNRFGGTSEAAIQSNLWLPAGEPVDITNVFIDEDNPNQTLDIEYTEGDTYLQRFDCIKTYPYTLNDQNSVTDVISFICESRINIDGRYDRNRGQIHNFALTPTNFNLLNPVYTQKNNFFNYRILDPKRFNVNAFANTVTWTKSKSAGALVDNWTNITLANTLDLDGDKGSLRALKRFNNMIMAFQDKAIARILFNEKAQIATSTGIPVELADSNKVEGKLYLNNNIGCVNKWSIKDTLYGLYFIDDINKDVYLYNEQFNNISLTTGFVNFFNKTVTGEMWNPKDFNNFIVHADTINSVVYFINKNYCLGFDESIKQFVSFYSYENTPSVIPLEKDILLLRTNLKTTPTPYYNTSVWLQHKGEYNYFFGEFKPFYVTYIANENPVIDKIFTNLEFQSDCYDSNNNNVEFTFNTLDVWNEYQFGHLDLFDVKNKPSSLKKKFRTWRTDFPRASYGSFTQLLNKENLGDLHKVLNTKYPELSVNDYKKTRDRIRNQWAYVKLTMDTENNYRFILHDTIVKYLQ